MENSIYLGLSRQMALQLDMNVTANNIANSNTPGFRAQNLVFEEFIENTRSARSDSADDELSFVYNEGQYDITKPGALRVTNNTLDIALVGPGFFGVQGPGGEVNYSRAGNLHMNQNGTLVTSAGFAVADQGGGPINIPPFSTDIKIDANGNVSNQDGPIAQIMVQEFENPQTLAPIGNNLYRSDDAGEPATETIVKQGHIEGSNVNTVVEVTRMIKILRSFQSTQQLLTTENDRLRSAIQKLTEGG